MIGGGIITSLLGKLGIQGSLMIAAVALSGYLWWMWDIEKKTVIELRTSIGKMEVINDTNNATIEELKSDNLRKDALHEESVQNIKDELGDRDERISKLQKRNKFLFDKAVKKPFDTGNSINDAYREWMCKLNSGSDCASNQDSGENPLPSTSVGDAESDRDTDDNSHD